MADGKEAVVYDFQNLPKVIPGTRGWMMPKRDEVAFCRVPTDTDVVLPASWNSPPKNTAAGTAHVCIKGGADWDAYPNVEFGDYYVEGDVLPETDERTAWLVKYWRDKGYEVEVRAAIKVKPTLVIGVAACEGKLRGAEGDVDFVMGDVILQSPTDAPKVWRIKPNVVLKRYDDQGIRQGSPS